MISYLNVDIVISDKLFYFYWLFYDFYIWFSCFYIDFTEDDFKVGIFVVFENFFILSGVEIGDVAFFKGFTRASCYTFILLVILFLFLDN